MRIPEEMLTMYQRKWVKSVRESPKMKRKSWRTSNKSQKEIDGKKGKSWQLDLSVRLLVFVGVEKEGVWFEWIVLNTEARTTWHAWEQQKKKEKKNRNQASTQNSRGLLIRIAYQREKKSSFNHQANPHILQQRIVWATTCRSGLPQPLSSQMGKRRCSNNMLLVNVWICLNTCKRRKRFDPTRVFFFFFFFFTQVQTPVPLCSGEWWSLLVVRLAHSADLRSCLRHVSSAPSVAYNTGCSRVVTHPGTNPAWQCLTSVILREPVCHRRLAV